jgi:hypothetical protein
MGPLENGLSELGSYSQRFVSAPGHETGHLRILIANERRDRRELLAQVVHSQRNGSKLAGVGAAIVESPLMPATAPAPTENR